MPAAALASSTTEAAALSSAPPATTRHVIKGLPPSTKPFNEHVTDIRQQVVVIYSKGGDGSGFFIAPDLLLTNHHVVAEDRFVKVRTLTGRELAGEVLVSDARRDIALIRTERSGFTGLPVRQDEPGIGSQVFVIGTPGVDGLKRGALEATVTSGIISAYRDAKEGHFIQSDVHVTHGNSGGPMFDDKGNVIGLTDLGYGQFANLFIPINDGLKALNVEIETPVALDTTAAKAPR